MCVEVCMFIVGQSVYIHLWNRSKTLKLNSLDVITNFFHPHNQTDIIYSFLDCLSFGHFSVLAC